MNDFFNIPLPKWPECRVMGKNVTKEQAAEIIIRTDSFGFSTNDREFQKELIIALGLNYKKEYPHYDYNELDKKKLEYQILDIYYLYNSRICSSYIGGPHGWINWDGKVEQFHKNIGKYPSVESVYNEWNIITTTFPYLELTCQLFDGENCEDNTKPVIQFDIKKGKVVMSIPTGELVSKNNIESFDDILRNRFSNPFAERGCTIEEFEESLKIVKKKLTNKQ